jgi:hypothetical protein
MSKSSICRFISRPTASRSYTIKQRPCHPPIIFNHKREGIPPTPASFACLLLLDNLSCFGTRPFHVNSRIPIIHSISRPNQVYHASVLPPFKARKSQSFAPGCCVRRLFEITRKRRSGAKLLRVYI